MNRRNIFKILIVFVMFNAILINITHQGVSLACTKDNKWNYKCGKQKKKNPKSVTNNGVILIKDFEGFHKYKYKGLDNYNWTIGYGHVIENNENISEPISKKNATKLLKSDLKGEVTPVRKYLNNVVKIHVKSNQFDAVTSLSFNAGHGVLSKKASPEFTKLLKSGKWNKKKIVKEFGTYCGYHSNGEYKHSEGLWRRHVNEALLFMTGKYKNYTVKQLKKMGYKFPY